MYKIAKPTKTILKVQLGEEILDVDVTANLNKYKEFLRHKKTLAMLTSKLNKATDDEEIIDLFSKACEGIIEFVFGKENKDKITDFFDQNFDQAITSILPFIYNDYTKALEKAQARQGKQKLESL